MPMSPDLLPLRGATLAITRPAHNAARLLRRVRALGGIPLRLPGLSLRALDADAATTQQLHQTIAAADELVFISPAAVDFAFRLLPGLQLRAGQRAWTVGGGTTRALARRGIAALAPQTSQDSEGLLAMPALQQLQARRAVIVGAPGGRSIMQPALEQRGAQVERVHVYQRVPPRLTRRHAQAVCSAGQPLLTLLSSAEALDNIIRLLPVDAGQRLRCSGIVVASARLATLAQQHGFVHIHTAVSAMEDDLLDAAIQLTESHRSALPHASSCVSMRP